MKTTIECIVDSPERKDVENTLSGLSHAIAELYEVDVNITDIEKTSGLFEEAYVGSIILTIGTSVLTGIAANAIWSWILSKKSELNEDVKPTTHNSIRVKTGSVNIVITINNKK